MYLVLHTVTRYYSHFTLPTTTKIEETPITKKKVCLVFITTYTVSKGWNLDVSDKSLPSHYTLIKCPGYWPCGFAGFAFLLLIC